MSVILTKPVILSNEKNLLKSREIIQPCGPQDDDVMPVILSNAKNLLIGSYCLIQVFFCSVCFGETRILPPKIGVAQSKSSDSSSAMQNSTVFLAEIPIPVDLNIAMPFISVEQLTERSDTFKRDQRLSVGLLHHAAEGAPLWKLAVGAWTSEDTKKSLYQKTSFNLEKVFPQLRPNNSDQLSSWIELASVTTDEARTLSLINLGWRWKSSEGFLVDLELPSRAMLGWTEEKWQGEIGYTEKWMFVSTDQRLETKRRQLFLLEAKRTLFTEVFLTLLGGVESLKQPYYGLELTWIPRP